MTANLNYANLSGANLTDANLRSAYLSGVRYNALTQWPVGFDPIDAGAVEVAR